MDLDGRPKNDVLSDSCVFNIVCMHGFLIVFCHFNNTTIVVIMMYLKHSYKCLPLHVHNASTGINAHVRDIILQLFLIVLSRLALIIRKHSLVGISEEGVIHTP